MGNGYMQNVWFGSIYEWTPNTQTKDLQDIELVGLFNIQQIRGIYREGPSP